MKTIAFLNLKGGVGKSTSTVLTATSLEHMGYKVKVKDADPSGRSYAWMRKAKSNGTPLPFPVEVASSASIEDTEMDEDYDFVLIDTPPDMSNSLSSAIDAVSDVIVIVTKPGYLDQDRTFDTFSSFESPRALLLNFARPRQKSTRDALKEISDKGIARFDTLIPERESTHNASAGGNQVPTDSGYIEFTLELIETLKG